MAYKDGDVTLYKTGSPEVLLSSWGQRVKISFEEGGSSKKTLDGSLKTDIMYWKYRFEIPYKLIDQTSLDAIMTLYKLNSSLNLKLYTSPTTWFLNFADAIPVVKLMPFSQDRSIKTDKRYWENVNLVLVEK
jgi:hypothetical protein